VTTQNRRINFDVRRFGRNIYAVVNFSSLFDNSLPDIMADVPPSASPTTTKKRKTETTTALLRRNNRLDDLERDEAAPPMTPETDETDKRERRERRNKMRRERKLAKKETKATNVAAANSSADETDKSEKRERRNKKRRERYLAKKETKATNVAAANSSERLPLQPTMQPSSSSSSGQFDNNARTAAGAEDDECFEAEPPPMRVRTLRSPDAKAANDEARRLQRESAQESPRPNSLRSPQEVSAGVLSRHI
jgi:hypothetical protein